MARPLTTALILALLFALAAVPADARRKRPRFEDKRDNISAIPLIEPDPVTRHAKPDSHPSLLRQPSILGGGRGYADNHLHGIDVSHYQGRIDWQQVARSPKAGYVYLKASEGASYQDDTYAYNLSEARRNGLKVGSYHFFRPGVAAEVQFRNFMSMVDVRQQDILPVIDVEVASGASALMFHARLQELLRLVAQQFGRNPIIYTGTNFYNKHFHANAAYRDYPFFIAAYTDVEPELNGNDDYIMWQYTGRGEMQGIRGDVDQSRFVGRHTLREILLR